jgi:hypothetical protein
MSRNVTRLQKIAWGFAAMFLGVYLLDYVPGIIADNGKMFGLFSITTIVDLGHLALGVLAAIAAWHSAKAARIYFWVLGVWYSIDVIVYFFSHLRNTPLIVNILVNTPHTIITIAAFWIAVKIAPRELARVHAQSGS